MKRPTSWNIKAIFVGWAVGFFGASIAGVALFIPMSGMLSARGATEQQINRLWNELPFLFTLLVIEVLSHIVSGFIAAHLARRDELSHAGFVGLVGVLIFIAFSIPLPDRVSPLWYNVLSFAFILPCSILGGYLRLRRPRRESPQAPTHPPIPEP